MKKIVLIVGSALIIIAALMLLLKGLSGEDSWICQNNQWLKHGQPSSPMPETPCGDVNAAPAEAGDNAQMANPASTNCLDNGGQTEIRTDLVGNQFGVCIFSDDTRCEEWRYFREECQPGNNIAVFAPQLKQEVSLPFTVSGDARVFENQFSYRLKDAAGKIIASGLAYAHAEDLGLFGVFNITIGNLSQLPASEIVVLEVYDNAAKDGEEIDTVSVPLALKLPETQAVKIYFNNNKLDPEISCNKVFPVERIIPKTEAIGTAALELLLAGPSEQDAKNGFQTSLNENTGLNSLTIENGVAKADFDSTLDQPGGGSCRVGAITAQIRETLKQFPAVKEVVISIDGRTEDILQP